jgi:alkylation response protein AidB-like acyl-CoA dehydrogenase
MLADMSTQLEAARLLLHDAAASGEQFPDIDKAARAKIFASETAIKVTNDALQFYGSSGYGRHEPMERHVRDARMFTIAGDSNSAWPRSLGRVRRALRQPRVQRLERFGDFGHG